MIGGARLRALGVVIGLGAFPPPPAYPTVALATGVYAVPGDTGRGSEGRANAGFVVTDSGVIVIDAGGSPYQAKRHDRYDIHPPRRAQSKHKVTLGCSVTRIITGVFCGARIVFTDGVPMTRLLRRDHSRKFVRQIQRAYMPGGEDEGEILGVWSANRK